MVDLPTADGKSKRRPGSISVTVLSSLVYTFFLEEAVRLLLWAAFEMELGRKGAGKVDLEFLFLVCFSLLLQEH